MRPVAIRNLTSDSGVVAVWLALSMLMILGILSLVVDLSYAALTRNVLQSAADGAALSACDQWIENPMIPAAEITSEAERAVTQYSDSIPDDNVTVSTEIESSDPKQLLVKVECEQNTFFGRLFGIDTFTVHAESRAQMRRLIGGRYLGPWAILTAGKPNSVMVRVRSRAWYGSTRMVVLDTVSADGLTFSGTLPGYMFPDSDPGTPTVRAGAYDVCELRYYNEESGAMRFVEAESSVYANLGCFFTKTPDQPVEAVSWGDPDALWVECDGVEGPVNGAWPTVEATISGEATSVSVVPGATNVLHTTTSVVASSTTIAYVHRIRAGGPVSSVIVTPSVVATSSEVRIIVKFSGFDPTDPRHTMKNGVPREFYLRQAGNPYGVDLRYMTGDYALIARQSYSTGVNYDISSWRADQVVQVSGMPCASDPAYTCTQKWFDTNGIKNRRSDWIRSGYPGAIHIGDSVYFRNTEWLPMNSWVERRKVVPIAVGVKSALGIRVKGMCSFVVTNASIDSGTTIKGYFTSGTATPHQYIRDVDVTSTAGVNALYAARLVK